MPHKETITFRRQQSKTFHKRYVKWVTNGISAKQKLAVTLHLFVVSRRRYHFVLKSRMYKSKNSDQKSFYSEGKKEKKINFEVFQFITQKAWFQQALVWTTDSLKCFNFFVWNFKLNLRANQTNCNKKKLIECKN